MVEYFFFVLLWAFSYLKCKLMKKLLFLIIIVCCVNVQVLAQQNPVEGYVITNAGDTIYGTIDYQTRGRLARVCHFLRDGETAYVAYQPGQIAGFRLMNDGVYFVTRTFLVDGQEQTIFAEYLLQGGVSLYRYENTWTNAQYYLVDQDGKVALVRDPGDLSAYTVEDARKKRELALGPALHLLRKSHKAWEQLQDGSITANKMLLITREYNEEYCQADGDCVVFQYDAKKSSTSNYHFSVEAGTFIGALREEGKIDVNAVGLHLAGGVEWFFPRRSKHFSLQLMLELNTISKSGTYSYYSSFSGENVQKEWSVTVAEIGVHMGTNYRFIPAGKITPLIGGGVFLSRPIGKTRDIPYASDYDKENLSDKDDGFELPTNFGIYVGGGVEMKLGKHALQAIFRYELPLLKLDTYTKGLVATLGFLF